MISLAPPDPPLTSVPNCGQQAFAALPENVTSNQALVANTLLYHVYSGNLMSNGSGHQILRSALNDSMYVQLREFRLPLLSFLALRY